MGIAYPIIVDKISNIGERYSSNYLSVLFNNEFPQKNIKFSVFGLKVEISFFKLTLFSTIISFLFLILDCKPLFGWNNLFINNSADALVLLLTIFLTIFFFVWLNKVVLYNGKPTALLNYIIKKYSSLKDDESDREYYLKTINEFTFYAISKQDDHLQESLLQFYYSEFSKIRSLHDKNVPLIYPVDLYLLVYKINFEVANNKNLKLQAIEHRAVSGSWLLGESFSEIKISSETYSWIWRNLYIICDTDKYIKMYWGKVSEYFEYSLDMVQPKVDYELNQIINQNEIDNRKKERRDFIEFHYAFGGLLLYKEKYSCLRYLFTYSQSLPPKYVLLPEFMTQIFEWFEAFRNEYKEREAAIDLKYYFPELDNLGNRRQVIYWICSYISLLFLRQYTLKKYYVTQDFTGQPALPDGIQELYNWQEGLPFFEKCLGDIMKNKKLLDELKYNEIVNANSDNIKKFISDLKSSIINKIDEKEEQERLLPERIKLFSDSTKSIITAAFSSFDKIFIPLLNDSSDTHSEIRLRGFQTLFPKAAFAENSSHMNFHSVFAESISRNVIQKQIPNSFVESRTRRYLLKEENVVEGIDKLGLNKNEFVVVAVNPTEKLINIIEKYSDIIERIPSSEYDIHNTLFVLKKTNLPSISHEKLSEEEISNDKLELIDDGLKLYMSIVDLNSDSAIKEKWSGSENSKKVQMTIAFSAIISWKKGIEIVQINIESPYKEQGIPNELSDIIPFNTEKKRT